MASTLEAIPARFHRADAKEELIVWIRATRLPSRFKRKLLQEWAAAMRVELPASDYERVAQKGEG